MAPPRESQEMEIDIKIDSSCMCPLQIWSFFSFLLFYAELNHYIAVSYILNNDYYWFSFQTCFWYNFIILLIWILLSFVIYTVCWLILLILDCCDSPKTYNGNFIAFIKNSIYEPIKMVIINLWPLSPFLGLIYLYPICLDIEFKKKYCSKEKLIRYVTILHEMIKSGGSMILQIYSFVSGFDINRIILIISLMLNFVQFLKCKLFVLHIIHTHESLREKKLSKEKLSEEKILSKWRKFTRYFIVIFEIACMATTFLTFLRYGKLFALFYYVIVLAVNIFYTILLKRNHKTSNGIIEKMEDYMITMHDYLCLVCIRVFLITDFKYFLMEVAQLLKLITLIVLCAYVYQITHNAEAIVAICCDGILLILMVLHSWMACKESTEDETNKNSEIVYSCEKGNIVRSRLDNTEKQFIANNLKTNAE